MSDTAGTRSPIAGGGTIPVVLSNTMGSKTWDIDVPIDKPVAILIRKMLKVTGDPLRDANGVAQTYQVQWKEGDRYLRDPETMQSAEVQPGHTLVLAYEARAGSYGNFIVPLAILSLAPRRASNE